MKNPFEYGKLVSDAAFCNRTEELVSLTKALKNGQSIFLYSERRVGKTSLIKKVLSQLPKSDFISIYVDLWPTHGEPGFIGSYAKALSEAFNPTIDKMLKTAKDLFAGLQPSIIFDDSGSPQISFGLGRGQLPKRTLEYVLDIPMKMSIKTKKSVVVVFDEFQQIMEYQSDMVERQIRSVIQKQTTVTYAFLGSRKHLMSKLFQDYSRPLYRSASHFPLSLIKEEHWIPFIIEKFELGGKKISPMLVQRICNDTEGHPAYTQHLCHVLWDLTEVGVEATVELLTQAIDTLLEREGQVFSITWESLATNQRKVLIALIKEPDDVKLFSNYVAEKYGFGKASSVERAVGALIERNIVDEDQGKHIITDRFFRLWLRRLASQVPFYWDL